MKKPTKMGNCYEDVFKHFCYENEIPGMEMVHGILDGRRVLQGWTYGHAWLELGDVVFQPVKQKGGKTYGLAFVDRKERFYERYNIDPKKSKRYTKDQAMKLGVSKGNFGPWHDLGLGKDGLSIHRRRKMKKLTKKQLSALESLIYDLDELDNKPRRLFSSLREVADVFLSGKAYEDYQGKKHKKKVLSSIDQFEEYYYLFLNIPEIIKEVADAIISTKRELMEKDSYFDDDPDAVSHYE